MMMCISILTIRARLFIVLEILTEYVSVHIRCRESGDLERTQGLAHLRCDVIRLCACVPSATVVAYPVGAIGACWVYALNIMGRGCKSMVGFGCGLLVHCVINAM